LRAIENFAHPRNIGAAQQAIDAELAHDARRVATGLRRLLYDLHVGDGSQRPDTIGQSMQHRGLDAYILEPDVPEAKRRDLREDVDAILDGLVATGQHEDEVHANFPSDGWNELIEPARGGQDIENGEAVADFA